MRTLTYQRDTDLLMMEYLPDEDLLNLCLIENRYIYNLCSDENFWRNRFTRKFGPNAAKYKPLDRTWKRHYLTVIRDLNEYSLDEMLDIISEHIYVLVKSKRIDDTINNEFMSEEIPENVKNLYWLYDLGDTITIYFTYYHQVITYTAKRHNNGKNFTPADLVRLISKYYDDESVTEEEYEYLIEQENSYALHGHITLDDIRTGEIKKYAFVSDFLDGIDYDDNMFFPDFNVN